MSLLNLLLTNSDKWQIVTVILSEHRGNVELILFMVSKNGFLSDANRMDSLHPIRQSNFLISK